MLCKIQGRILQFSGHFNFPRDFAFGGYLLKVLFHFLCFQREINSFEESVKLNIQTFSILIYSKQLIFSRHICKLFSDNSNKNSFFCKFFSLCTFSASIWHWCQHDHPSKSPCCIATQADSTLRQIEKNHHISEISIISL